MDPISAAIVAGLLAGATKVSSDILFEAYSALKGTIKRRFGSDSELARAVEAVARAPNPSHGNRCSGKRLPGLEPARIPASSRPPTPCWTRSEPSPTGGKSSSRLSAAAERRPDGMSSSIPAAQVATYIRPTSTYIKPLNPRKFEPIR